MNYEEQVRAMLRHAASLQYATRQDEAAEMGKVVEALGKGIAIVAMGLPKASMATFVVEVSRAIGMQITEYLTEQGAAIPAEDFLRDVFKPEKFHG
jgi:hypothetical protein